MLRTRENIHEYWEQVAKDMVASEMSEKTNDESIRHQTKGQEHDFRNSANRNGRK